MELSGSISEITLDPILYINPREPMEPTKTGIVIRQQAWFRSLIYTEDLTPFPIDQIDSVSIEPVNTFRPRVLLGRGPIERDLQTYAFPWFEHGEKQYPTFECPSIGPIGAGLMATHNTHRLSVSAEEALGLIEISLILPVAKTFREQYETSPQDYGVDSPASLVQQWLEDSKMWLEQAIGMYALYQFPIVWESLGMSPMIGFVDLEAKTFQAATTFPIDNFIPFRLRADSKIKDGYLLDEGLVDLARLANQKFHFPLLLLQRCLWQRNIEVRYLEAFLVLDYLANQATFQDPARSERERLHEIIMQCINDSHPEYKERVMALKPIILQAPLRERLSNYFESLNVEVDATVLRKMLKVRNDLAHANIIDQIALVQLELELRRIVRIVFRKELSTRGITFGNSA